MNTILLLLDALRHDYISEERTPFLFKCSKNGDYTKKIIPNLGFCERAEFLTGKTNTENDLLTAFGYSETPNEWSKMSTRLALLAKAELITKKFPLSKDRLQWITSRFRYISKKLFLRNSVANSTYSIPLDLLQWFSLTEDAIDHTSPNPFESESIFDLLRKNKKSFSYEMFTSLADHSPQRTDEERLQRALEVYKSERPNFIPIYISSPDTLGHKYGPTSKELYQNLTKLDHQLFNFVEKIHATEPNTRFIFLGDHGMLDVTGSIDAHAEITRIGKQKKQKERKDFIVFLDSTILRVWFLNDQCKKIMKPEILRSQLFSQNGTYNNNYSRRYGDITWLANPGLLISPDYFRHGKLCKGMHGYDPTLNESKGTCILWGPSISPCTHQESELTEVYNIIRKSLEN